MRSMIADNDGRRTVDMVKANVDILSVVLHRSNGVLACLDFRHCECWEGVV